MAFSGHWLIIFSIKKEKATAPKEAIARNHA